MPHKHHTSRRHHIGKMKLKVTNWAEYEAGLRHHGSLTLWITPEVLAGWTAQRRKTRGGQLRYPDLAIETTLMLGMVFGLRLRQKEGLFGLGIWAAGVGFGGAGSHDVELTRQNLEAIEQKP